MKKANVITIGDFTSYTVEDYKEMWSYQDEIDYYSLFFSIFNRHDFIKRLDRFLQQIDHNDYDQYKEFILYYIDYKPDMVHEYSNIEECIKAIETQISDIEYEIKNLEEEKKQAENEYEKIADDVREQTGNYINIQNTQSTSKIRVAIPTPKDDYDLDDQIDDLERWSREYWEKDEEIGRQEEYLQMAKDNLNTATNQLNTLGDMMYD